MECEALHEEDRHSREWALCCTLTHFVAHTHRPDELQHHRLEKIASFGAISELIGPLSSLKAQKENSTSSSLPSLGSDYHEKVHFLGTCATRTCDFYINADARAQCLNCNCMEISYNSIKPEWFPQTIPQTDLLAPKISSVPQSQLSFLPAISSVFWDAKT